MESYLCPLIYYPLAPQGYPRETDEALAYRDLSQKSTFPH